MKVLQITVHLGGGAGKAITGIAARGDTIVLLERPQKTYWVNEARKKGIYVIIEPDAAVLENLVRESDLTIINWWGHPLMIQLMPKLSDIPCRLVLYCHVNGCVYPYLPFSFLNEFDAVMFTTPYSYENPLWTGREKEIIRNKSAVVYGMGEFCPEQMIPDRIYDKKDIFEIGYIGTLNYAKLNPDFVKYCEAAAERINDIRFVLAGDMAKEVERDIRRSRIADKFSCVGHTDNVEAFYRRIDVLGYLLNSYNFATTENVLLEAMAYATPIIALDQGVEKYILEDGRGGELVTGLKEYADKVYLLYASEEKRAVLGKKARDFCIKKYSYKKNRDRYHAVMCGCLKRAERKHEMECLKGKLPFEWLLLFAQKDREDFYDCLEAVFFQETKGSVFQYYQYFGDDPELKKMCEMLSRERMDIR